MEMKRKKTQQTKSRTLLGKNVQEQKKWPPAVAIQQARNVAIVKSGVTRKKNAKKLIAQRVFSMVTRQTTARLNHAYIVVADPLRARWVPARQGQPGTAPFP